MRPKSCWIYVSHSGVTLSDNCRKAYTQQGTCLEADGYADDGTRLELKGEFPHLVLNGNKDVRRDLQRDVPDRAPTHLLHEYTKTLSQTESGSVRDVSRKWERRFPGLFAHLTRALDDTDRSHEQTARCVIGPSDVIHMDVVLDLHSTSGFPEGTSLNGDVAFGIGRRDLLSHSWSSKTCVVKPRELYYGGPETTDWSEPCELRPASADTLKIPFPADSLARAFVQLAKYVTADRGRAEPGEPGTETAKGGGGRTKAAAKTPTALSMLEQMAVYQEIWSTPHDGASERDWKRRTVIMWTFSHVRNKVERDKVSPIPPGTSWRFLTKLDPASQYHQQRAYVPGTPSVARDNVMSPDPGFHHHLGAAMHEHIGSAYDAAPMPLPGPQPQQPPKGHLAGLSLLDSFPNGLVTPPPTACLPSNYAPSFGGATAASNESLYPHPHPSYLSDTSGSDGVGALVADTADSFLAGLVVPAPSAGAAYEEPGAAWAEHRADDGLHGLDAAGPWGTASFDGPPSLAWATGGGGDLGDEPSAWPPHDGSPGPAGPWADDKVAALWGPAMPSDAWATGPAEPWLSAVPPPPPPLPHHPQYREEGLPTLPSSHGIAIKQEPGDGTAPPSGPPTTTTTTTQSRKRGRADDPDDPDGAYPQRSLRKLHHGDRPTNAPPAVMEEHGVLFLQ